MNEHSKYLHQSILREQQDFEIFSEGRTLIIKNNRPSFVVFVVVSENNRPKRFVHFKLVHWGSLWTGFNVLSIA